MQINMMHQQQYPLRLGVTLDCTQPLGTCVYVCGGGRVYVYVCVCVGVGVGVGAFVRRVRGEEGV